MKKVEDAITYFEALLDRLGNGDSDNLVCATALEALREKRDRDVTGNNRINAEMNLQEMLTEKQLQALVDCGEKEDCAGETCPMFDICDNDYTNKVAAEAAKTALAYRKMLERLETVLKQARAVLEEIEKCCEINIDDGYHACKRKCREATARARFFRGVIDELEGSEC